MNDPAQSSIREGDWVHVLTHQATGKVIEKLFLWGNSSFRVWLPSTDSIIRVSPFHIRPVHGEELSAESVNLQVVRHGLEEEFVMLGKLPSGNGA